MASWDFLQVTNAGATALAALAAALSATTAFLSFRLTRKLTEELKEDEILVAGVPFHPQLANLSHQQAVLCLTVFNKYHRKAYIKSVNLLDSCGAPVSIEWSDSIDTYGNTQNPSHLVGITHSVTLCMRTKDGEPIRPAVKMIIEHSFPNSPLVTDFNPPQIPTAPTPG